MALSAEARYRIFLATTDRVVGTEIADAIDAAESFSAPADSTATPGDVTQTGRNGRVAIAAGSASVTVTNSGITTGSVVHATLQSADATLTQILRVVPGSGSFEIVGNAAALADCNVAWSWMA